MNATRAGWLAHYQGVQRMLLGLTRHRQEAEDLAQQTFLRALEHADTLDGYSDGHVRAWLFRTARNAFIDQARRQRRLAPLEAEQLPPYEQDFSGLHVEQRLGELPQNLREVVTLRHLEGYTSIQISAMLGIPPATVRTRLRTALILLRRAEEKDYEEG